MEQPINRVIKRSHLRTGLFILALLWLLGVATSYAQMIPQLPESLLERTFDNLIGLFQVQFLGFLVILASFVILPLKRYRGYLVAAFFAVSAAYILSLPRRLDLAAEFLGFIFWWCFSLAGGHRLLHRISPRIASLGIAGGVLIAALVPVWFFLGLLGILNAWWVGAVFLLILAAGMVLAGPSVVTAFRSLIKRAGYIGVLGFTSLELILILLTISFIWTNSPEAGSDSARSHLPLAQDYAREGNLDQYFVNWGRFMPKPAQTWSAAAITVGGVQTTKWLSWMYLVLCIFLIAEEMYRRTRSLDFSILSALVVLSCPYLLYLSTTLYIDHLILLLNLTALFLVFRASGPQRLKILAVSALVIGSLAQIKYNTLLFALVWSSAVAWNLLRHFQLSASLKKGAAIALLFLISASPWYIYTYAKTGNPLFPYFNGIFHSPLWPEGTPSTLGQEKYTLGDEAYAWIRFPWIVTFDTSHVSNRHDGIMGYWMLGLIPIGLLGMNRRWLKNGLEPTLAGAAGIFLVGLFTLNSRYWLPAYPLVILGLLLGAREFYRKAGIRLVLDLKLLAAFLLTAMILVTIPFWTAFNHFGFFPLEVYTGEKTGREWSGFLYPGIQAVESLNRFVCGKEGVLATNFQAVYAVNARAYEFPFWHTNILGLKTADNLEEFFQRNRIRYWAVNLRNADDKRFFNSRFDTNSHFWSDDRLVAASHQVAVFDVSNREPVVNMIVERVISEPLQLCEPGAREDCTEWRVRNPGSGETVRMLDSGRVRIPAGGSVWKVYPIHTGADLVEFSVRAAAKERTTLILSLEWLDSSGGQLDLTIGGIASGTAFDLFEGPIYGNIPSGVEKVRVRVRPWRTSASVFDPQVRFLGVSKAENGGR